MSIQELRAERFQEILAATLGTRTMEMEGKYSSQHTACFATARSTEITVVHKRGNM